MCVCARGLLRQVFDAAVHLDEQQRLFTPATQPRASRVTADQIFNVTAHHFDQYPEKYLHRLGKDGIIKSSLYVPGVESRTSGVACSLRGTNEYT